MATNRTTTLSTITPDAVAHGPTAAPAAKGGYPPIVDAATLIDEEPTAHADVIAGLFDEGAVVEIIGPSKVRKSFFAMQIALSIATGFDMPGFEVAKTRRVLIVNTELTPDDFHRRLWHMARQLQATPIAASDRLHVIHLRGVPGDIQDMIEDAALKLAADIIIIDPIYTLIAGAENSAEALLPLVEFLNRLATGRAGVIYIHHDAKGDVAGRSIQDRGAGSNVLARNAYARITMTPHRADPVNAVVLAFMLRGYPPHDRIVLRFRDDAFVECDLPPEEQTAADRKARNGRPRLDSYTKTAVSIVDNAPVSPKVFKARLREDGLSKDKADDLVAMLVQDDGPLRRWSEPGFPPRWFIGKTEHARSSRSSG